MRQIAVLLALIMLSGCSVLFSGEYRVTQEHIDASAAPSPAANIPVVRDYDELKKAILRLITADDSVSAVIRLVSYEGNAERDAQEVCRQILLEEPMGAYLLDFLSPELTALVGEYELRLTLTRRRKVQDIRRIEYVGGAAAFNQLVSSLYQNRGTSLTAETSFFVEDAYDPERYLRSVYDNFPVLAQGMPDVSLSVYPETGRSRLLEVTVTYALSADELAAREKACRAAADAYAEQAQSEEEPARAWELYNILSDEFEFDSENWQILADGGLVRPSVYDALVGHNALPETYALAYKAVCDAAGIECRVVRGRHGVNEYAWNLIKLDGDWYHADLATDALLETRVRFLMNDNAMAEEYRWDTANFPAANGQLTLDGLEE